MANASLGAVLEYLRQSLEVPGTWALSDSELLEEFLTQGREKAFAALVHRHGPMVLTIPG